MYLIFDTETTGLPQNYNAPVSDSANWPRLVQLAWQLHDDMGRLLEVKNYIVKPEGFTIPYSSEKVHGISTEKAEKEGEPLSFVLEEFSKAFQKSKFLVGHNIEFDINIVGAEYFRLGIDNGFMSIPILDTKEESTNYCALPGGKGGKFKWPTLSELHFKLFKENFEEAHNASADVVATARCFLELVRLGIFTSTKLRCEETVITNFRKINPTVIQPIELTIESHKELTTETVLEEDLSDKAQSTDIDSTVPFTHLHVHTQYSILDGAADIKGLVKKVKDDGMVALAITDHGNMFGVKDFYNTCKKNEIKPIIGCEVYVARRTRRDKEDKSDGGGNHLVLLAKNHTGYKNLMKLVSFGWTEGFYYKPRIDKGLLEKYHEGIIALSACLNGVISDKVRHQGLDAAREELKFYKSLFGEDFYLELQRHPSGDPEMDKEVYEDQVFVNRHLVDLAYEFNLTYIATNDVHFINKDDAEAHDRLLCISTGKDVDDKNRMRYTTQEWLKTQTEMRELFSDLPDALANTMKVVEKIEDIELDSQPIMPDFPLPEGFETEADYLRHITFEGAKERWEEITPEIEQRLTFELDTIINMGFPGYFLIVWDFIKAAREMNVSVGPGRGSAAGSVVAYCLKITDIDPIKYDLLFERFLNPDRISMPDIDIDFDEDGREKVLDWVVQKYGKKRVAHIITFGSMAPKMAIRDVARVQKLPLSEADRLAKLVPERPGTTFKKAYTEVPELIQEKTSPNELVARTLKYAEVLEGSVRQTGVHACGIIIGRNDLEEHVPICINKDAELYVTQYDGKHVESVGMLKMDFLGLKTLSIIKDAVENIKFSKGVDIDIDDVPLNDEETFALYSRGDTTGLFQFESPGMKKHLRALKPNRFEDLIAMNALYRPGPMEYIPSFINRKHGREQIHYDLPEMEEYLKDTYGITVYQEQVMLLSQRLAGFTKGMADSLRKAMGKKIKALMDELKVKFEEGCKKNGYSEKIFQKIWKDWEAFAQYAFNKSHSTCYAYVSYQTAYLKAHYPAEFMAAVLSRNMNDIKKITFFMDECKRMGLSVLGPDVNESFQRFTVNKEGDIRFGMAAIKGVGASAVQHIIEEREQHGPFNDIYNFVERINLATVNKKNFEGLVLAGAFDSFSDIKRHQYFGNDGDISFIESLLRYGNKMQSESNAAPTLFGGVENIEVSKPNIPHCEEWPTLVKLSKEKELIGIYLSSHPLDQYKFELQQLKITPLSELKDLASLNGKEITVAGIVSQAGERFTKNGNPFGTMTIEDYTDSFNITMFSKDYIGFKNYFAKGYYLLIKGRVQENPWRKDRNELEFKINYIQMLSQLRDEGFKNISLKIPLSYISDSLIMDLEQYTDKNGKILLKFLIYDHENNISVDMFSRTRKVNLSDDFIRYLEENQEIEYKVS
jgi:DNA polymerase-3 subunit alpha